MARVNKVISKVVIYPNRDLSKGIILEGTMNNNIQETNTIAQNTNLINAYLLGEKKVTIDGRTFSYHNLQNPTTGALLIKKGDLIRVFVKEVKSKLDEKLNVNKTTDLLQEFILDSWSINSAEKTISLKATDKDSKMFNRTWSGSIGIKFSGSSPTINNNVITTSLTFEPNKLTGLTFQFTNGGIDYTYLITSNTTNTITVHKNVTESVTNFLIGDSSPYVIYKVLSTNVNKSNYTGDYDILLGFDLKIGQFYEKGIQLLRPNNSAFPIVSDTYINEPVYQILSYMSSRSAISTVYEITTGNYIMLRDMVYGTYFDNEYGKYRMDFFYVESPELQIKGQILEISGNTVTLDKTIQNGFKNFLMKVNGLTYQIKDSSDNKVILLTTPLFNINDAYYIYSQIDFVWDSNEDFKNIISYNLGETILEDYNLIHFKAGKNNWQKLEIIGSQYNEQTKLSEVKDTLKTFSWLSTQLEEEIGLQDSTTIDNGKYNYPSYPFTFPDYYGFGGQTVNSNSDFDLNFYDIVSNRAKALCKQIFDKLIGVRIQGQMVLKGNRFVRQGDTEEATKLYKRGTRILFKDVRLGFVKTSQQNGYYTLLVDRVTQVIDSNSWTTTIEVKEVNFIDTELQNNYK